MRQYSFTKSQKGMEEKDTGWMESGGLGSPLLFLGWMGLPLCHKVSFCPLLHLRVFCLDVLRKLLPKSGYASSCVLLVVVVLKGLE